MLGFGEIAEQLRRSTVQIENGPSGARSRHAGSGFIVKSDGVIVTNAHVVSGAPVGAGSARPQIRLWDGSTFPSTVEARSTRRDLAVLRIPTTGLAPVTLGNSDQARVGELVIAVGNPFGFMGAVTTGVIHAMGMRPELGPGKWIQSEVQLAPGNSGGPLADARGNVIGVNTMIAGGLGLAVPSNAVARLLSGELQRAPLGVVIAPTLVRTPSAERLGLSILEVVEGSAAEYASLKAGDTLLGIEGRPLGSLDDLEQALEGRGERILKLQFVRDDPSKLRSVTVRIGAPQFAAA